MLEVASTPCVLCDDVPCARACPSGALLPLAREDVRIGLAVVLPNLCLNRRGETCDDCLAVCPLPELALKGGPDHVPLVDPDHCTGCGLCAKHCKSYPKAIHIKPL